MLEICWIWFININRSSNRNSCVRSRVSHQILPYLLKADIACTLLANWINQSYRFNHMYIMCIQRCAHCTCNKTYVIYVQRLCKDAYDKHEIRYVGHLTNRRGRTDARNRFSLLKGWIRLIIRMVLKIKRSVISGLPFVVFVWCIF